MDELTDLPAVTVVLSFDVDGMAGGVNPDRFDLASAARGSSPSRPPIASCGCFTPAGFRQPSSCRARPHRHFRDW